MHPSLQTEDNKVSSDGTDRREVTGKIGWMEQTHGDTGTQTAKHAQIERDSRWNVKVLVQPMQLAADPISDSAADWKVWEPKTVLAMDCILL